MTAADELERLAEEFDGEAKIIARESAAGTFGAGHGAGMSATASRLRARAAELRAAVHVPTLNLPKPDRVEVGSMWLREERITVARVVGDTVLIGKGVSMPAKQLLEDPRYRYLGKKEET